MFAQLRPRQVEATEQIPNYAVQHFLPPDVGRITGGLLAIANFARPRRYGDQLDSTPDADPPEPLDDGEGQGAEPILDRADPAYPY